MKKEKRLGIIIPRKRSVVALPAKQKTGAGAHKDKKKEANKKACRSK